MFEALAMACPAVGSFLSIHGSICGGMIDRFGYADEGEPAAAALHDGEVLLLLPDRAGLGLRRRRAEDKGRAHQRGLEAQRQQGLHLGRGLFEST